MTEDKTFESDDFTLNNLPKDDYEYCTFIDCKFADSDLSNIAFRECEFIDCDLSLAKLKYTVLNDIVFKNCKLLGLHFNDCDDLLLSFRFENCNLELAVFYDLNLKNTVFTDCSFNGTDFTESDLSGSAFVNCNLKHTVFDRTKLEQADFRSAYNFSIDPEANSIKKARFSKENLAGLLYKYHIKVES